MVTYLPCTRCGASLSIVEGSLVQCFFCGTKTVHSEALAFLNDLLLDILNISSNEKDSIDNEEINRRKTSIESYFHEINTRFYDYKFLRYNI